MFAALALLAATITPLCFFAGPELAAHALQAPLLCVIEKYYGPVAGWCIRFFSVWFLAAWIASIAAIPLTILLRFILRREISSLDCGVMAVIFLAYLSATAMQGSHANAKLALFSSKFGIAVLIAALYRVNDGWRVIPDAMNFSGALVHPLSDPQMQWDYLYSSTWTGFTRLVCYTAPLVFLASDLSHRMERKKHVWVAAGMGILLPLGLTMLTVEVIELSTSRSRFYTPSLQPSVAMALWGKTAESASSGGFMLACITLFGAARFGVNAMNSILSTSRLGSKWRSIVPGCLLGLVGWGAIHRFNELIELGLNVSSTCLAITAAVVTADLVNGRFRAEPVHRIDWVGLGAMLVGLATILVIRFGSGDQANIMYTRSWFLPAYATAFLVCTLGRSVQRYWYRYNTERACDVEPLE